MVSNKDLAYSEKKIREIDNRTLTALVKELTKDDSSDEYKLWICDEICKRQRLRDKWEEETSDSWFHLGRLEGMSIGIWIGATCFVGGQLIGAYIKSKIES